MKTSNILVLTKTWGSLFKGDSYRTSVGGNSSNHKEEIKGNEELEGESLAIADRRNGNTTSQEGVEHTL